MPQLDSLRALAFLGVAVSHWLPGNPLGFVGGTGVQLFFVLSGFLITGILLDYRRIHEANPALTAGAALRMFYIRRFLRIFPLYYGVIAVALLLNIGPIRQLWPWHVFYVPNFLYGIFTPHPPDPFTHFWTLGVEEQFYLVWPFIILLVRFKTLENLILALIVIAPLFRIGMQIAFPQLHRVNYFPISCADSLGVGACLALATRHHFRQTSAPEVARRLARLGIAGMVVSAPFALLVPEAARQTGHTFLVLFYGWLVFHAANGFSGAFGAVLNRPELQFIGKISYGLYVFHHFLTYVPFAQYLANIGLPASLSTAPLLLFFLRLGATFILAVISWYAYERPLNELKRHFTVANELKQATPAIAADARTS
jgi:peptidoglycan/LPS O-acetylase OafA/YrhL